MRIRQKNETREIKLYGRKSMS